MAGSGVFDAAEPEDLVIERILVRHGFTREMADELLLETQSALDYLAQYPPEASSTLRAGRRGCQLA